MKFLILGGGPAGIAAAKAVRKAKEDAEILIATEEKTAPYLRPLMPDFILGDATAENTLDPEGKDLQQKKIRIAYGAGPSGSIRGQGGVVLRRDAGAVRPPSHRDGARCDVPEILRKKSPMIIPFDSWKDAIAHQGAGALPPRRGLRAGYLAFERAAACGRRRRRSSGSSRTSPGSGTRSPASSRRASSTTCGTAGRGSRTATRSST
jgi:hypothetical protein